MKSLDDYSIKDGDWCCYTSELCSVSCSLDYPDVTSLASRINELVQSYFNQWQFVVSTYDKLDSLLVELNRSDDKVEVTNTLTEYDIKSAQMGKEFSDYAYLLIISMKTLLDLFACLVDICITQNGGDEFKMTDFYKVGNWRDKSKFLNVRTLLEKYRDKDIFEWIYHLTQARNRLVHRGYHLRPRFSFSKENELRFIIYKGTDFYCDILVVEINSLFEKFIHDLPVMENEIATLLNETINVQNDYKLSASFKFSQLATEFSTKEL